MPAVDVEHVSPLPAEAVWNALIDIEEYPKHMADVERVEVLSDDGDRRVSRWTVLLKGSTMTWTEEERLDHRTFRLEFEQTEGDLASYLGHYQLEPRGDSARVLMHIEFDIGIPDVAEMLNPIASEALKENLMATLAYVEKRCGVPVADAPAAG
jgi:uncharacterized membrane protein